MSEFLPRVVELSEQNVQKHPNADTLSVANIDGVNVVFKTSDFPIPCLAAYLPEDSVLPATPDGRWDFLGPKRTVVSKKLRGVLSVGMLAPLPAPHDSEWIVGQDVTEVFGITKAQEPDMVEDTATGAIACPFNFPVYTDLNAFGKAAFYNEEAGLVYDENGNVVDVNYVRRNVFEGKDVVITEKIHGTNARFVFKDGQLWVGSRTVVKNPNGKSNWWWRVARDMNLEERFRLAGPVYHDLVFFGEIYGPSVQKLGYGVENGALQFRVFDILDLRYGTYMNWSDVKWFSQQMGFEVVPVLYEGPYDDIADQLEGFANGKTTLDAEHMREGFVIKDVEGSTHPRTFERNIYKYIGNEYRENKGKGKKDEQMAAINQKYKKLVEAIKAHRQLSNEKGPSLFNDVALYNVLDSLQG